MSAFSGSTDSARLSSSIDGRATPAYLGRALHIRSISSVSSGLGTDDMPTATLLYQIVEEYYPAFKAHLAARGDALPDYVEQEFEGYLSAGPPPKKSSGEPSHFRSLEPRLTSAATRPRGRFPILKSLW